MRVSMARVLVAGAATGLVGVLALTAMQASVATPAQAGASAGKTAPSPGPSGDPALKRAAAAREDHGSGASAAEAAAKRAAAAREDHGSGPSAAEAAAKRAAARQPSSSGSENLLLRPGAASSIARTLGVSEDAASRALRSLVPLSEAADGLDVASPGFVAAAAALGVSPAQLARAVGVLKAAE